MFSKKFVELTKIYRPIWLAASMALFFIFSLIFQHYHAMQKYKDVWKLRYIKNQERNTLLIELKAIIGYGGGIHNFKNYVLRGSNHYLYTSNNELKRALKIIDILKQKHLVLADQKKPLDDLYATLNEYYQHTNALMQEKIKRKNATQLDRIVKLDDSKAIRALEVLMKFHRKAISNNVIAHHKSINQFYESIMTWTFIFVSLFLIGFVHILLKMISDERKIRLVNNQLILAQEELAQEKQASLHYLKLSVMSQMSGSIAHEINNPLMIISGNAQGLLKSINKNIYDKNHFKKSVEIILLTVERIANVITCLRNLARDASMDEFEVIVLNDLVNEVFSLTYERVQSKAIMLESCIEESITVYGQKAQIAQVLLNLISNSIEAISEQEEKWIRITAQMINHKTKIYISDSGPGIAEDIEKKLLLPFFTSKKNLEHIGIGLSLSKNMLEKQFGSLKYDRNSENTTFIIELNSVKFEKVKDKAA